MKRLLEGGVYKTAVFRSGNTATNVAGSSIEFSTDSDYFDT